MAPSSSLAATLFEASQRCDPAPALALRYALFGALALGSASALATPPALLLAWLGAANLLLAHAYARGYPGIFGKRQDGGMAPLAVLSLLPYLVLVWGFFALKLSGLRREPCFHQAAADLYIGRWPRPSELPPDCRLVIDLTSEFPEARRGPHGVAYLCLPILNRHTPSPDALLALLQAVVNFEGGLYVHCGAGRGRSAMLVAALLVLRGHSADLDDAQRMLVRLRPGVHLHRAQRSLIARVCPLVVTARTARLASEPKTLSELDRSKCA